MHKQVAARWQEFVGCFLAAMLEALFSVCAYLLLLWSAFGRSIEENELGRAGLPGRQGRQEQTTAQTGKGCLGQGVQIPLLA